jgi:chromosome segregation protein
MFIKRLEIYGFKSFPYKVSIPFSPKITAIVGPNGSGKSNILDAIRWVLGEQSPKKLRIKELSDLIFSGNSNRNIDFAEVKLLLNHEPPVWEIYKDFPEILITRRFYRNGESEYFINQKPCRLKDIQFLFLDLGVNPQSYGIIEQGEVSKFIDLSPKERKILLEDLAGVSKLKITEENTLKNLQKTEENLLRLKDIINEVKGQYEILKKQAEEARKYLSLKEKLQKLLIQKNLYLLELNQKEKEKLEKRKEELLNKKQTLEKEVESLGKEEQAIYQEILILERKIKDLKKDLQSKENYLKEHKENLENLIKQENELNHKLEKIKLKRENEEEKFNNFNKELSAIEISLKNLREKKETLNENLINLKREKEKISKIFEEKLKNFQIFEKEYLLTEKEEENLKEKGNSLKKKISQLKKEKDINEKILEDLSIKLKNLEKEKKALENLFKEKEKTLEDLINFKEKIIEESKELYKKLENFNAKKQNLLIEIQSLKDRLGLIEKILSKNLSSISKNLNLPSLESYLNLSTEDISLLELIFKENLDAFVIEELNLIKNFVSQDLKENIIFLWGEPEIIKSFSIEKYNSFSDEILESYKTHPRFIYFIKEKILLTPYGFICFIRKEKKGIFSLKKEKIDLLNKVEALEKDLKTLLEKEKELKLKIENLEKEFKRVEKEIKNINNGLENLRSQREKIEISCIKLETEKRNLGEKVNHIENELKSLKNEKENLNKKLIDISELINRRKKEYETVKKENLSLKENLEEINQKINFLEQEIIKIKTEEENLRKRKDLIQEEIKKIKTFLRQYEFDKEALLKEINYLKDKIKEFNKRIKNLSSEISDLTKVLEDLLMKKEEGEKKLKALENKKRKIERELKELDTEEHNLELNLLEKKLFLDSIYRNLKEFGFEIETEFIQENKENFNLEEVEEAIEKTKNLLNEFKEVNLASLREFEFVSQRYEKLMKEKEDLEVSIREFKKILENIREISRERILKTLEEVNKKLEEIFPLVFKNGKVELLLSGEDPLSSGLELKINFPHKGLKHINMLSGGEKALCALVILISFYLVKPGPFCILDEVDAFLDEKNSLKFIKLLDLIKRSSQIILITHNPHIMKEVDTLLGVTMEEKGISKIFVLKKENFFNEYINH